MTIEDKLENCKHRNTDVNKLHLCNDPKSHISMSIFIHNNCEYQVRYGNSTYCLYNTEVEKNEK